MLVSENDFKRRDPLTDVKERKFEKEKRISLEQLRIIKPNV